MKEVEDVSIWLFIWQFVVILINIGIIYLIYFLIKKIKKAK